MLFTRVADAAVTRSYSGESVGSDGVGGISGFERLQSVATDQADGSIFVLDVGSGGTIYKFDATGTPSNFSSTGTNAIGNVGGSVGELTFAENQLAVAPPGSPGGTAGYIYLANNTSSLSVFAPDGSKLGELEIGEETCGVATDAAGHVFVGSYPSTIREYTPSSGLITASDKTGESTGVASEICNVSADSAGHLFATTYQGSETFRLESLSATSASTIEPSGTALGVDPSNQDLYVGSTESVSIYSPAGSLRGSFPGPGSAGASGIAIAPDSSAAYVGDPSAGRVRIYGPLLTVPGGSTEPATDVTATTATFNGILDPEGGPPASCEFQYVTVTAFADEGFADPQSAPCSPAGSFAEPTQVSATVADLYGGTRYVVRLFAISVNGSSGVKPEEFTTAPGSLPAQAHFGPCPNDRFRSGWGAQLPDCRAYEQASATDKGGGSAGGWENLVRAAPSGDAVTFYSQGGVPGGSGSQTFPTFLTRRAGETWLTQGLLPPQPAAEIAEVLGVTADLRYVVSAVTNRGVGTGLMIEDTLTRELATVVPYTLGVSRSAFAFASVSADGSRFFFESTLPLTGQTPAGQQNLFVWDRASGQVTLVGELPSGGPAPEGSFGGPYRWAGSNANLSQGGTRAKYYVEGIHAISTDGDRAYFTAGGTGELFLRSGLDGTTPSTVQVNASQKTNGSGPGGTDPHGPQPAIFAGATADGSRAFLLSPEELTDEATTGSADQGMDLYRFEADAGGVLQDLTPDPFDPKGADVQGVLGASADGAVVYFAANGVLAPGAEPGNCSRAGTLGGEERACSIYRYSSAATPHITFVARVKGTGSFDEAARNDSLDWSPAVANLSGNSGQGQRTARVSADGEVLLFSSRRSLTGYDSAGGCGSESCPEFFRFAAATAAISCVSCSPAGKAPTQMETASLEAEKVNAALAPSGTEALPAAVFTRNLSADGARVFFQTAEPLVSTDTNGVTDVYEWEAPGSGSCADPNPYGGCVYLLSIGQSRQPAAIADADEAGASVFLFSPSRLVPADRDDLYDVYSARVQGGLQSQNQAPPASCLGEACQGLPTPPPGLLPAASAAVNGPGNKKAKLGPKKHKKKRSCRKGHRCKHSHVGGKKKHTSNPSHGGGK